MATWQEAIVRRQADATDHVMISVQNREHDAGAPHTGGSGTIRYDTVEGLYAVCSTADDVRNRFFDERQEDLTEEQVEHALSICGITNSDWV